jgi:hypothetical protein
MGIDLVARRAASTSVEDVTKMTSTFMRTKSAATSGSLDTLKSRLAHLKASPAFGYGRAVLVQLTPTDVETYKADRLAEKASGATINRELYVLAHMIARGRDLGHVTGTLRVRLHRMAESPARQGFFEPAQYHALMAVLPKHLRPVVAFGYESRLAAPGDHVTMLAPRGPRGGHRAARAWRDEERPPADDPGAPPSSWPSSRLSGPRPRGSGKARPSAIARCSSAPVG